MSEATDLIMPVLRNIQQELAGLKTNLGKVEEKVDGLAEEFAQIRPYITYTIGLHSENKVDIETLNQWKADVDRRLALLEAQRHP